LPAELSGIHARPQHDGRTAYVVPVRGGAVAVAVGVDLVSRIADRRRVARLVAAARSRERGRPAEQCEPDEREAARRHPDLPYCRAHDEVKRFSRGGRARSNSLRAEDSSSRAWAGRRR
jgi:hypothetical protein